MIKFFTDKLVYSIFGLSPESAIANMLHFFIYDSVKVLFLLFVMISVIGVLRTYLPQGKVKSWVHGRGVLGNIFASFFGALTPFCSCSSIPGMAW